MIEEFLIMMYVDKKLIYLMGGSIFIAVSSLLLHLISSFINLRNKVIKLELYFMQFIIRAIRYFAYNSQLQSLNNTNLKTKT